MNAFQFYIGNPLQLVPEPDNWQQLELELSFENTSPEAILNNTKLIWKASNAAYMNTWVQLGLSGGFGIFEGIPLVIKVCSTQEIVFDGIIDLTDVETKFTCDIVQARIRDKRMDMVSQLFDSVSFAYLATPTASGGAGIINPAPIQNGGDYVVIPYQLNQLPDYFQLMSLCIVIFTVVDKYNEVIDTLGGLVSGDAAAAADVLGGEDGTLLGIFEIIFYVLYLIALVIVMYELLKAAFQCIVSPVFSKFGMYATTLMQKACNYFGLQFSSSILTSSPYNRLVIMPQKSAWANNNSLPMTLFQQFTGSVPNRIEYDDYYNWLHNGSSSGTFKDIAAYGYYDGTCGDFVRAMEEVFNAKAKITINNNGQPVLNFERWDYQYNLSTYTLPNISDQTPFNSKGLFNTTGYSQSAFGTNAHEVSANYMVRYAVDANDYNTLGVYEGTSCYCTTRPNVISVQRNVLLQHLTERNMPFAQALRKDNQTFAELMLAPVWFLAAAIFNTAASLVNVIVSVYNFIANLFGLPNLNSINYMPLNPPFAAIGHMLLSNHITGVPKMFLATTSNGTGQSYTNFFDYSGRNMSGVVIDINNRSIIGARYLMKNFHFSSLPQTVVPPSPYNFPYQAGQTYYNQYLLYKQQRIPLCCGDYDLIKNNNIIKTFDGKFAKCDSIKWNPFKAEADIDYRVLWQYTSNLKTTFVIDGKQTTPVL